MNRNTKFYISIFLAFFVLSLLLFLIDNTKEEKSDLDWKTKNIVDDIDSIYRNYTTYEILSIKGLDSDNGKSYFIVEYQYYINGDNELNSMSAILIYKEGSDNSILYREIDKDLYPEEYKEFRRETEGKSFTYNLNKKDIAEILRKFGK